jgi:hypothetical protein
MAKSVEIGSGSFRTQKSALDHYKAVLHRYQDGQRVSKQDDHADLVALIERYDPVRVYSTQTGHRFHAKLDSDSTANWTVGA